MIDLEAMPFKLWGMKYLVLTKEEISNYIKDRTLKTKISDEMYRFNLEDIFSKYSSIESMRANQEELDIIESKNRDQWLRNG